ncbi:winged helix-turn-helix transcriptional regulator [Marinomonas transparens]|uniref:Helix-turn-helix transcriptional regulator n=1 Tax=Marinomonas transparens TaxID=2795388 RepID=A0A934JLP7_9GAMM|nr:helix-turn-helix domain-containing protein [Marinomonas transparens]MBJ7536369.1 helix-turn-helix transcriptional regulator [Marinomonas transparens]
MEEKVNLVKEALSERYRRGDVLSDQCPAREVLKHISSRWGGLVLIALHEGDTFRFSELRRIIQGVSEKMLAQTLQVLEQDGLVLRTSFPVVPPHVEYSLTKLGSEAAVHVVGLANWIEENLSGILAGNKDSIEEAP